MGQKEAARAKVAELEFEVESHANAQEALEVLEAAAASAAPGGLKGTIRCGSKSIDDDGLRSTWELRGPGGVVRILDFAVTARPEGAGSTVRMTVGSFTYTKGKYFMPPTINGASQMRKFKDVVVAHLGGSR